MRPRGSILVLLKIVLMYFKIHSKGQKYTYSIESFFKLLFIIIFIENNGRDSQLVSFVLKCPPSMVLYYKAKVSP